MATVIAPAVAFGDRTVTARYFGTGNASRLIWNLAGMDSDRALLMPVIYRKDWQMPGHYRLYSTARTNLILQSQTINVTGWSGTDITLTGDQTTAPDGTATADSVLEKATTAQHFTVQGGINPTANTIYTLSAYVKPIGRDYFILQYNAGGLAVSRSFNITTGSIGSVNVGGGSASIYSAGNGWYRCVLTCPATANTTAGVVRLWISDADNQSSYAGDITKGIYLWGAQLETGSSATSYIPTTTVAASVTDYAVDANGKVTFAAAPVANADVAYLDPWFGTAVYKSFGTGDGTATQFSLPWKPVTPAIYIDGVLQTLTTNYTVTPGGAVTFVVAPGNGAVLTWTGNMGAQR